MKVEQNLPVIRERKLAILKGDPELCAQQKKAGKLLARERIALLLDAASFVELDVLNADAGVVTGYGLIESTFNGCCAALGFTLAMVLFACIREKLSLAKMPKWMDGFPGALITAGLMALAFQGFSGLI